MVCPNPHTITTPKTIGINLIENEYYRCLCSAIVCERIACFTLFDPCRVQQTDQSINFLLMKINLSVSCIIMASIPVGRSVRFGHILTLE